MPQKGDWGGGNKVLIIMPHAINREGLFKFN